MFRSSVPRLLILVLAGLLVASCRPPSSAKKRFDFQTVFVDGFNSFQGRAWQPFAVQGGRDHKIINGRLRLSAEDQGFGVPRSLVRLKSVGFYDSAEALMAVNGQDENAAAELEIRYTEDGDDHYAVWSIAWIKDSNDWTIQPMILDEDFGIVQSGPTDQVQAGDFHRYRIAIDPQRETLEFMIDGVVRWQADRSKVATQPGSRLGVGQYWGGYCEIDEFRAERRDLASHVLLDNTRSAHAQPSHVRILFNLRDASGNPLLLDKSGLDARVQIDAREDGAPLDRAESPVHLRAAADLELDVVLVLDYTESMRAAGGGTGIDEMKAAAQRIIYSLAPNHRVAVVEFHDNLGGDDFSTLVPFTFDKNEAVAAVRDFEPFHGFSKLWDAVDHGLQLFPATPVAGRLNVLVFLSDGFDASSSQSPGQVIATAQARSVRVHSVGVEEQRFLDQEEMERVAADTGGRFFTTEAVGDLVRVFGSIGQELSATYQAAWVSARSVGFTATLWLSLDGIRSLSPVTSSVLPDVLSGDSRQGRIEPPTATTSGATADFFFVAEHLPRTVQELRFRFDTSGVPIEQSDLSVSLSAGPLAGWTLVQEGGDWWRASGPLLGFGDFGPLVQIQVAHGGQDFDLPFIWDNSVYANGVLFFAGDEGELVGNEWQSTISIIGN